MFLAVNTVKKVLAGSTQIVKKGETRVSIKKTDSILETVKAVVAETHCLRLSTLTAIIIVSTFPASGHRPWQARKKGGCSGFFIL